jgi:rod shape determining protein RodA
MLFKWLKSRTISGVNPIRGPFFSEKQIRRQQWQEFKQFYIKKTDWLGVFCVLTLSITGIFFIYSSQLYSGEKQYIRQIFWLILGLGVYGAISLTDYRVLFKYAHWIWLISLFLLVLVAFDNPLSMESGGARRWINLRVFSFQPSESAKTGVLILTAAILSRANLQSRSEAVRTLGSISLVIIPPILLIFSQPDLGSALVIPPMILSMLFVSRLSLRFFVAVIGAATLFLAVLAWDISGYIHYLETNRNKPAEEVVSYQSQSWFPLKDYQRNRIIGFVAPHVLDPHGTGNSWNLNQSLISIGSGGLEGKGWTQGTQAMLGYLPKSIAHTDFIFSVLAEEKGFIGGLFVIGLSSILIANGIRIATLAEDRFGMLLCIGVTVIYAVHILVNVGMTLGLMPITGVPLPFLSYGGSFLLSCCFLQGLTQSVYRWRKS